MVRPAALVILLTYICVAGARAQVRPPRAAEYLFITGVGDARALWVNPAGLGALPEASLFGEFMVDRQNGSSKLGQWTVAFNSRGFSAGYQRNMFVADSSYGVLRLGAGVPFPGGAFGLGVSTYFQSGPNDREGDLGIMWAPIRSVTLGGTVQHIGRPVVNGIKLPLTLTGGAQWSGLQGIVNLAAEAKAAEITDPGRSGVDLSWRGGANFTLRTKVPVTLLGVVAFGSTFRVDRWQIGFAIGGRNQVAFVGTAVSRDEIVHFDNVSVGGVASNILTAR